MRIRAPKPYTVTLDNTLQYTTEVISPKAAADYGATLLEGGTGTLSVTNVKGEVFRYLVLKTKRGKTRVQRVRPGHE